MKLLEEFSQGKRAGASEDRVVVTAAHAFVIDGASDPTGLAVEGLSGGEWVAEAVAQACRRIPSHADAVEAVSLLTAEVRARLERCAPELLQAGRRRPFCHLVAYSAARREVWRLGDGHLRVGRSVHLGSKEVDDVAYRFRRAVLLGRLAAGEDLEMLAAIDPGTEAAAALYAVQHLFQNAPADSLLSYGCIDGTDVDPGHLEVFSAAAGEEVVLASDGFFDLSGSLADAEASLEAAVTSDPLSVGEPLWRFGKGPKPGYLAPDDRSWVRLLVE